MLQYIVRRTLLVIPTLAAIVAISFLVVQLPAGDYLTSYIAQLQSQGTQLNDSQIASLKAFYALDQPMYKQFVRWIRNVLHGDLGMSFQWNRPVAGLIGERLLLTVVISVATLVFTWTLALPIGVYSATHQYSIMDYLFTLVGFVGRSIPDFMIALILMWFALSRFGVSVGGLFSEQFANVPWSGAKFVDMLKHLWVPAVVLGMGGTAGLVRIMRANLLDELHKPYVVTARAKGMKENILLWKYPVRVALNPFASSIGWLLPGLLSGGTIVSIVLSLPTVGPLLLESLLSQDTYVASSILLFLGGLTIIGTFISDIVLAILDPRIRYGEER